MTKRLLPLIVLLCVIPILSAASAADKPAKKAYVELLRDMKYQQGFNVKGLSPVSDGSAVRAVLDYGKSDLQPQWSLAQWSSKYSLADDARLSELKKGVFRYTNKNKIITVDTHAGEIALKALASLNYDRPRKADEPWMHLLLEQELALNDKKNLEQYKIDRMKELRLKMKVKLSYFKDLMKERADAGKHAAQYTMFLYIADLNSKTKGYGDMIWFGVPLFDNRYEFQDVYAAQDTGQPGASGLYIYSMSNRTYMKKPFFIAEEEKIVGSDKNPWITIDVDLLPHIKKAYVQAKKNNYLKNTSLNELYVNGINFGWELPGTYDVEMKLKDLSLQALAK